MANLEAHKAKLEAKGFDIGPLMTGDPVEPWYNRLLLRERFGPPVMGSWMVFSQIDYNDDVIRFVDVEETAHAVVWRGVVAAHDVRPRAGVSS